MEFTAHYYIIRRVSTQAKELFAGKTRSVRVVEGAFCIIEYSHHFCGISDSYGFVIASCGQGVV